ncbi:MAG: hypothetical protein HYV95_04370 [Opitutae bacterium]|nr:hypothetical protein [Opitutae bacterium]
MRQGALHALLWSGLAATLWGTAYLLISTTFMLYDDEGYLLYSLRSYLEGHRLYDEIFSQYGPWPYVYHQLVTSVLQHPLTHTLGRILTSFHWVAAAILGGMLTRRLTGRISLGLAATVIIFGLLWQMCSEPNHPGSMISVLVALAVLGGTQLPESRRAPVIAGIIGALAALLCLSKINVGLLLIAGAGCACIRCIGWPGRWRQIVDRMAAIGLLAVPWVLMAKKLSDPWALTFALHFTAGAAGLLWVTPERWTGRPLRPSILAAAAAGFIATGFAVGTVVWVHGSSWSAITEAVLITPLRQPSNFSLGFTWVPAVWPVAVGAWLLTAMAGMEMRRDDRVSRLVRSLLITARIAALIVFAFHAQAWVTINGVGRFIVFCLPLLPVFLVPLGSREQAATGSAPRSAVWCAAFFALPQVLHAFPVAGSQLGWGTFLLVPFFVSGLYEAWVSLEELVTPTRRWLVPTSTAALLAISSYQLWLLVSNGGERYHTSRPLDLPGAEDIRLDEPTRMRLRILTLNASIHADTLFSRPGMFSYNLWSGAPTPTTENATHWFWLLSHPQQLRIAEKLQSARRSAIITNQSLEEFMVKYNVPTAGPLQDFIAIHYQPLFTLPDFRFLVPHGSKAVPFGLVERFEKTTGDAADADHLMLRVNLALDGVPASLRAETSRYPWPVVRDYNNATVRAYIEPINSSGQILGPALPMPTTVALHGLYRLTILEAQSAQNPNPGAVLIVTDPKGRVLGEALFQ